MERQAPPLRRALGLTVLAGTLAACASLAPRPEEAPAQDDPAWLLPHVARALAAGPRAAVLEGRASQYSDAGAIKGKVELLVDRTLGFRMTGLSPTDDVLSVVASSADAFVAFARGGDVCHVGTPCPSNVARFASVPLDPLALAGVLLGRPPLLEAAPTSAPPADSMRWDGEAGAWAFTRTLGAWQQTLWLARDRVLRVRLAEGGRVRVDARYGDFLATPEGEVPRRLAFALARGDTDLRIDLSHVDVTPDLTPAAFTAPCPAGMVVDPLPCEPSPPSPEPGVTP